MSQIDDQAAIAALMRCVVANALNAPTRESRALLKGLLVVGGDHDALDRIRDAYTHLTRAEEHLEACSPELFPQQQ